MKGKRGESRRMSSRGVALAEKAPKARLALNAFNSFRVPTNPPPHRLIILRFLGMINHMSDYVAGLSRKITSLCLLI